MGTGQKGATLLKETFGAKKVILFGTLAKRSWFKQWSDVNLAVWGIPHEKFYAAVGAVTSLTSDFKNDLVDAEECRDSICKARTHPGVGVKFSREKLDCAQEIIYDAWETGGRQKRIALARKAIKTSPYCADAYVLLAEESGDPVESLNFYEKGVLAGKMALGDLFFKKNAGLFWGLLDTRPYMRALAGLADSLWKLGHKHQAINHYKELLRLNPNDNQGIRYVLANCLRHRATKTLSLF